MAAERLDQSFQERLNALYWTSERTIDEIVEELGVSRNTLYASISPLDAQRSCPRCDGRLFFTNRRNLAARRATCSACGEDTVVTEEATPVATPDRAGDRSHRGRAPLSGSRWPDKGISISADRAALIGGAAALGIVIGAVAVRALRN